MAKPKGTWGGARPGSGPKRTPINTTRLVSLRGQGFSFAEIGRRLGVSAGIARRAYRHHKEEHEDRSDHS